MKQSEYQWVQLVSSGVPKLDAAAQVCIRGENVNSWVARVEKDWEVQDALARFAAQDAVNAAMVRKSVADTMTRLMIDEENVKPADRLKAAEGLMKLYRLGEEEDEGEDRRLFRALLRANLPQTPAQDP